MVDSNSTNSKYHLNLDVRVFKNEYSLDVFIKIPQPKTVWPKA